MKKYLAVLLALIILAGSLYFTFAPPTGSQTASATSNYPDGLLSSGELAVKAFEAGGARFDNLKLQAWGQIHNAYLPKMVIEEAARAAMETLGAAKYTLSAAETADFFGVTAAGGDQNHYLEVLIQSLVPQNGPGSTYMVVTVTTIQGPEEQELWAARLAETFKPYQTEPEIHTQLTGSFPGLLNLSQKNAVINRILSAAMARETSRAGEAAWVSIDALSDLTPEYINVWGNKVNLNLALRHEPAENRTWLFVGSPLLDGEY